jgi:hypothetical protein
VPDDAADVTPWAAPESRSLHDDRTDADLPLAEVASAGGPGAPVRLAPMTAGDILDGAVTIVRSRPTVVFAFVAVLVIPFNVLVAYLQRDFLGGAGLDEILSNPSLGLAGADSQASSSAALVSILLGPLTLSLVGVGMGYLVSAWYAGNDPTAADVLRRVLRRSGVALVVFTIVHIAELAGFAMLALPGLAVMALSVVASPVVGAEDLGPFASFGRSWTLAGRRFFPVLGLTMLTGLVVTVIGQVLLALPTTFAFLLGDSGWILLAVGGSVVGLLTTAMQASTATLIYIDLRVRTEGLDLELAARDKLDAAA